MERIEETITGVSASVCASLWPIGMFVQEDFFLIEERKKQLIQILQYTLKPTWSEIEENWF